MSSAVVEKRIYCNQVLLEALGFDIQLSCAGRRCSIAFDPTHDFIKSLISFGVFLLRCTDNLVVDEHLYVRRVIKLLVHPSLKFTGSIAMALPQSSGQVRALGSLNS